MSNWLNHKEDSSISDQSNVKFSIWRINPEDHKLYPMFVRPKDLQLDDILFVDSSKFVGFARLSDFLRGEDGSVSNFYIEDSGLPFEVEHTMAKIVVNMVKAAASRPGGLGVSKVIISLSEATTNA